MILINFKSTTLLSIISMSHHATETQKTQGVQQFTCSMEIDTGREVNFLNTWKTCNNNKIVVRSFQVQQR